MNYPRFDFCEDLNAPEFCVILDIDWWGKEKSNVLEWLDMQGVIRPAISTNLLYIADPAVRTAFALKWGGESS